MRYRYYTVDAFTNRAFEGAQIVVFPEASGLNDALMQKIAREFNVSETVFVFPAMSPTHARRLRIFTPRQEVPFGGHPTIAAAYVLSTIGAISGEEDFAERDDAGMYFAFEENVGPINITVRVSSLGQRECEFGLTAKYFVDRFTPPDSELAKIFGLQTASLGSDGFSPMVVACELPYLIVPVRSLAAVRAARFQHEAWAMSTAPSALTNQALLFTTQTESEDHDYHCRLLGPDIGVNEDPPIGSAIPAFCGYLAETRGPDQTFLAERGAGNSRRSLLRVSSERSAERCVSVRVGGTAVLVCDGHLHL